MAGDVQVRRVIRLKLQAGTLPKNPSGRLWAGPGDNEVCSACDETITKNQMLHEWEYSDSGKVAMHIRCWELWNEERLRVRGQRGSGPHPP